MEIGNLINNMDMGYIIIWVEQFIKDNGNKENITAKEYINFLTEVHIKVNGMNIKYMVKEFILIYKTKNGKVGLQMDHFNLNYKMNFDQ